MTVFDPGQPTVKGLFLNQSYISRQRAHLLFSLYTARVHKADGPSELSPVLRVGVFEQFSQLQRILADLLNWSEQEAIQRNVDHPLQQPAGFKEEHVLVDLHQFGELHAGVGMVVAILGINLEICLLHMNNSGRQK